MPSIDVAMARSVRGGVGRTVARSLQAAFEERDVASSISSVKESFSSWDNCMAAVYCKWPVIAVIIIGALIILSVVWCISRCLCCGLSCCCECCHCLKCCGQCCGCCDPPNGGRRKHLDEPYNNLPDSQGYKREDPMAASTLPFDHPRPTATKAEPPQYASFDVSKHADGKEDELPAMPVWGDSESKKVQLEQEAMELQQLKAPEVSAPLMNGMSPVGTPGTRTPVQGGASPYGPPGSQAASSGYLVGEPGGGVPGASPYNNMPGQQMRNSPYGQSTTSFQTEQSWGSTPGPMPQEYDRGQPQRPGYGSPAGYLQEPDGYGEQRVYGNANNNPTMANQGYAMRPARSMTGGSANSMRGGFPNRAHGSPAPPQGAFANERAFDPRIMPERTASPALQQGPFDPRLMPQRTGSPAQHQQQSEYPGDPRSLPQRTQSPAPTQGGFEQRNNLPQRIASPAQYWQPQQGAFAGAGPRANQQVQRQQQPPPQRAYSPAPQGQRAGAPDGYYQRGGLPPRAPPYRQGQDPAPGWQQNTPRRDDPQRMLPQRSQTVDRPMLDPPRSPGPRDNFSRPMRSNTFDQAQQQQEYGGEQVDNGGSFYPGYKAYQAGR